MGHFLLLLVLCQKGLFWYNFFLHLTINILGLYIFLNNSYVLRDKFSSLMLSFNNFGLQIAFFTMKVNFFEKQHFC